MLARQAFRKCLWPQTSIISRRVQQDTSETSTGNLEMTNVQFAPHQEKQNRKNPFVKVMITGKIDYELMEYPESHSADRYRDFIFWEEKVAKFIQENEHLSRAELTNSLSKLGIFKASIDLSYGGLNLSETELSKLIATLSYIPWLGALLAKCNIPVVKILQAHASDKLKEAYLPKLATGEFQSTLCYLESANKWNLEDMESTCVLSDTGDHWVINGQKLYVANAEDSNLFLVFARPTETNLFNTGYVGDDSISMFVVEKDLDSMIIEPTSNVSGLKGLQYSTITFKNTKVHKDNMVGHIDTGRLVFIDLLAPQNQYTGAQSIGMFKRCITNMVKFVLSRKHLEKNLHESQAMKIAVAELAYELFIMESLVYMTSGLFDMYQNQDVGLEMCITNYYCANRCVKGILNCLKIVGPESVYGEDTTIEYLNNALPFITFDLNEEATKNLLALEAVKYSSKEDKDLQLKKISRFETFGSNWHTFFGTAQKNLYLEGQLHPSVRPGLLQLLNCVKNVKSATHTLLYRYGQKIAQEQAECSKLGIMIVQCYALAATLSRASRSYCIGLRNAEHEVNMAIVLSIKVNDIVSKLHEDIERGTHASGITTFETIAKELYTKKGYYVAHPTQRNW